MHSAAFRAKEMKKVVAKIQQSEPNDFYDNRKKESDDGLRIVKRMGR